MYFQTRLNTSVGWQKIIEVDVNMRASSMCDIYWFKSQDVQMYPSLPVQRCVCWRFRADVREVVSSRHGGEH